MIKTNPFSLLLKSKKICEEKPSAFDHLSPEKRFDIFLLK